MKMSDSTFRNVMRLAFGLFVLELIASHVILHARVRRLERVMGADLIVIDAAPVPEPQRQPQRRPFHFEGSV